jgi:ribose 5-phosphate isomerase B
LLLVFRIAMKLVIACDHAGFPLKQRLCDEGKAAGCEVSDLGAFDDKPSDYPEFARLVAEAIQGGDAQRGILVCGSGVGVSVAANKFCGVRAAMCHDTFSARQGVEDDDMNVLCIGARIIGVELAAEVVRAFLKAEFSRAERHQRRLNKVLAFERNNFK